MSRVPPLHHPEPLPATAGSLLFARAALSGLALLLLLALAGPVRSQDGLGFGGGGPVGESVVEEQVEEQVEERVQDQIIDRTEELGFGGNLSLIEEQLEENVEEQVAETVEDAIVDSIEERVEDSTAEKVDEKVAESVEESIEDSLAETVEDNVTQSVEEQVEESVASVVEVSVEEGVEQNVEESVEVSVEEGVEQQVEAQVAMAVEDQLESEIDEIIDGIESEFDIREDRIHQGQWLVMAEPGVFEELEEEGYLFDNITELPGMGMWLADVAAPSSFDITEARQGVVDVVGSDRAEVDLNHIYTAGTTIASTDAGMAPRTALDFPEDTQDLSLRMGMIDSAVDVSHPSLARSNVKTRSFVSDSAKTPDFHGTAIASIIAANTDGYVGLAPNADLYAAAVFEEDARQGEIASTLNLIKALDWLISSEVDVVNVSLAGPPNRLLETALKRVAERDILIVAAAGNGGPGAEPMYPAAYSDVVAVTAVDARGRVFRLANRGDYLDLAAPGVDLLHARAGGGYTSSSGTSFAVPFAATAAARLIQLHPGEDTMARLYASAQDLGPQGRDEIYGYGLLQLTAR